MSKEMKYGLVGLLTGGFLVWILMSTILNQAGNGMMNFQSAGQRGMQKSEVIDAHFIEQMIPHHEDAINMAKLALVRATRPEVKQLAQNIIDSQESEVSKMRNWYKDWFGRELPSGDEVMNVHGMMSNNSGMHMGKMGDGSEMQRLEQSLDFDRAFVEEMIPHHQMAVMMASMLKNGTSRPEMSQLADEIIIAQTNEIDQMREWLRNWD